MKKKRNDYSENIAKVNNSAYNNAAKRVNSNYNTEFSQELAKDMKALEDTHNPNAKNKNSNNINNNK